MDIKFPLIGEPSPSESVGSCSTTSRKCRCFSRFSTCALLSIDDLLSTNSNRIHSFLDDAAVHCFRFCCTHLHANTNIERSRCCQRIFKPSIWTTSLPGAPTTVLGLLPLNSPFFQFPWNIFRPPHIFYPLTYCAGILSYLSLLLAPRVKSFFYSVPAVFTPRVIFYFTSLSSIPHLHISVTWGEVSSSSLFWIGFNKTPSVCRTILFQNPVLSH